MKRFLSVLLALLLAVTAISCTVTEPPADPVPPNEADPPEAPEESEPAAVIAPDDLEAVRQTSRFRVATFACDGSNTALHVKLPQEWTCVRNGNGFDLKADGTVIGSITQGASVRSGMTLAKSQTFEGVSVKVYTGMATVAEGAEPYYQVAFSYSEGKMLKTVLLEVKQYQVDATFIRWCMQPEATAIKSYNEIPSVLFEEGNGAENVLLIGNSFLFEEYSNIIKILRHLIQTDGKEGVMPYNFANGYATVTSTATGTGSYESIRNDIADGSFNIVFLCGLYSAEDVDNIAVIQQLCAQSGTRLVLLPAHNESRAQIDEAIKRYPDIPCLDWKGEIDDLIEGGVDEAEFVNDDAHGHSKPLAGYVGAHMIYRCIFGEMPPLLLKGAAIDQSYVNAQLGTYVDEGFTRVDEDQIKWLR